MTYAITNTGTSLCVATPYSPDFISAAKRELGATWDGTCWCFDARDAAEVAALLQRIFGWTAGMALVSALVYFDEDCTYSRRPCVLLGRVMVEAWGRDSGGTVGDGVRLRSGNIDSGGSTKNWTTVVSKGTELVVHDVPIGMVLDYVEGRRECRNVRVEMLRTSDIPWATEAQTLAAERARLLSRVSEIDAVLVDANWRI